MNRRSLKAFVVAIDLAAVAGFALLPVDRLLHDAGLFALLVAATALAGTASVRLPSLRTHVTATEPFVLTALAVVGPLAAGVAALAGVVGAAARRGSRPRGIHLAFNLGATFLSASAAAWMFLALGGVTGADALPLWPLAGATVAYFVVNTGLAAVVVSIDRGEKPLETWRRSFAWTAAGCFSSLTLAAALILLLGEIGAWGLVLVLPPAWLLLGYYRAHHRQLVEQQLRTTEVERLNSELERNIAELQETMAHVKRLEGLLPICMHCKKIRDGDDNWRRIEEYICEHSEAEFTHSLCSDCRSTHYPKRLASGSRRPGR